MTLLFHIPPPLLPCFVTIGPFLIDLLLLFFFFLLQEITTELGLSVWIFMPYNLRAFGIEDFAKELVQTFYVFFSVFICFLTHLLPIDRNDMIMILTCVGSILIIDRDFLLQKVLKLIILIGCFVFSLNFLFCVFPTIVAYGYT